MDERHGEFKVILLGCTEVGKTSLIDRYVQNRFSLSLSNSKFMYDVRQKTVLYNEETYQLTIVDTGGQEKYDCIPKSYYRNISGAFLVYDITNFRSFERLKKWHKRLQDCADEVPVILIGNKTDLEDQRQVPKEVSSSFARQHNFSCLEASALNGEGVEVCFQKMVETAVKRLKHQMQTSQKSFANAMSQLDGTSILLSPEPVRRKPKRPKRCC
jgi:Ras-related protein Rab-11A